jgi:hypothetical protein
MPRAATIDPLADTQRLSAVALADTVRHRRIQLDWDGVAVDPDSPVGRRLAERRQLTPWCKASLLCAVAAAAGASLLSLVV